MNPPSAAAPGGSRDHLVMAYPTPILISPWPDSDALNAEVRALVTAAETADRGISRSNVGGWHSPPDFFGRDEACIKALLARIERVMIELMRSVLSPSAEPRAFRFQIEGWANLLRPGGYHMLHNHPNAHWSGVYYVGDNPPVAGRPMSGKLEFVDPRPAASMLHLDEVSIYGRQLFDPRAGVMVVFPSWLQHLVHPYFGDGERITVSFNVVVTPTAAASASPSPSAAAAPSPPATGGGAIWSHP